MAGDERPRVIVGMAPSTVGLRALRIAVNEARRRAAALHVVRAYGVPVSTSWTPAQTLELAEQGAQEEIMRAFADTMGGPPADLDVVLVVSPGNAGRALVTYAYRDCDLLVVGVSRGARWWSPRRWSRGAVARYCVRHATCLVEVVPPDQFARDALRRGSSRRIRRELSSLTDC